MKVGPISSVQGLFLTLCLEISPGRVLGTLFGARDGTKIGLTPLLPLTLKAVSLPPRPKATISLVEAALESKRDLLRIPWDPQVSFLLSLGLSFPIVIECEIHKENLIPLPVFFQLGN